MIFKSCVSTRALILAAGLAVGGAAFSPAAMAATVKRRADPRDAQIQMMQQQLQALSAKVDRLESAAAAAAVPVAPPAPASAPVATLSGSSSPSPAPLGPTAGGVTILAAKPSIQSGDGRFAANLHGVMQFDAALYDQKGARPLAADFRRGAAATDIARARDLSSGTNFRRARIGIDGKAFGDFDYNVLFEFGGAGEEDAGHIQELWVQYSGIKPFHARIGAFPPSIGLEDQGSTNGAAFLERPAIADLSRSVAGGDFREAAQLWAAGDRWYASGAVSGRVVGVVNSQATGVTQPYDSALGFIGRAAFIPYKTDSSLIHLGMHGSYVAKTADTGGPDTAAAAIRYGVTLQERPELRVDGTRLISTGAIDAKHADTAGVEVAGQYNNLFVQGEYERIELQRRNAAAGVSDPDFSGFYVEGSWILTGERRKYNGNTFAFDAPTVDHPFSLSSGTWGAFEVAARYSTADLNYHAGALGTAPAADAVRGGEQTIWSGGVNWYMNSATRLMLDYQDVKIDRLSPSATTFLTPVGAQIGQRYHVVSLRSQFAF